MEEYVSVFSFIIVNQPSGVVVKGCGGPLL